MSINDNNLSNRESINEELNFDLLNKIGGNDPSFLKDMLSTYRTSLKQAIESIQNNYKNNKLDNIADAAHKMSPSSHSIGADKLYKLLKDLETNCRKNETHSQIESEIKAVCIEAKQILRKVNSKIKSL